MAGNPNPSPETRFQPGSTPNPGGKTKEQKRLEYEAAEMSARIRHRQLSVIAERIEAGLEPIEGMSAADLLRLMKDSEDRAYGSPKQAVQHGGDPENPLPVSIPVMFVSPDDLKAQTGD
jgi:hypothetical protein